MLKIIIISKKLAEQAAPEILIFSLFWIFENLFRGFVSQYISLVANCLNYNFFGNNPLVLDEEILSKKDPNSKYAKGPWKNAKNHNHLEKFGGI